MRTCKGDLIVFSIALICATRRQIPTSASTIQGRENNELIHHTLAGADAEGAQERGVGRGNLGGREARRQRLLGQSREALGRCDRRGGGDLSPALLLLLARAFSRSLSICMINTR